MGSSINKTTAVALKNKTGATVLRGDIVKLDTATAGGFLVASGTSNNNIGVVLDSGIDNNVNGMIAFSGYVPQINLVSGSSIGQYISIATTPKKAIPHSNIQPGSFGQVLNSGLTPDAVLWGTSSQRNDTYFSRLVALLEPDAIEPFVTGTFVYTVGDETKYILASWGTTFGNSGRMEVRNPAKPMAVRDITISGTSVNSIMIVLNPNTGTYSNPEALYYERLQDIEELPTKVVHLTGSSATSPLLPGPYGGIITRVCNFDYTWIGAIPSHNSGSAAYNFGNEIGDSTSDYQRMDNALLFPINKATISRVKSGVERTTGAGRGSVAYVILPPSWSIFPDSTTYLFREDFMGDSITTGTVWNRTQTAINNVEINTNFAWCGLFGNGSWGTNGMYSVTSFPRVSGTTYQCDVYPSDTTQPNLIVGFMDGSGSAYSYTAFAHGVDFTFSSGMKLQIYESGINRGNPGYWTPGCIYRVRITLGNSNNALYEIQGGPEYPPIGSSIWKNITPGVTSNNAANVYAGATLASAIQSYISDIKVFIR